MVDGRWPIQCGQHASDWSINGRTGIHVIVPSQIKQSASVRTSARTMASMPPMTVSTATGDGTMTTTADVSHPASRGPVADASELERSMDLGNAAAGTNMLPTSTNANSTHVLNNDNSRQGTIVSAVLNILSTMVGGGSLSLPLAFAQAGIGLVRPPHSRGHIDHVVSVHVISGRERPCRGKPAE